MKVEVLTLTGAPTQVLERILVFAAGAAIALIAAWYLAAGIVLAVSAHNGSHRLRRAIARWGPPILKGAAATMLASSVVAPATAAPTAVDLSWGSELAQSESAGSHVPKNVQPTPALGAGNRLPTVREPSQFEEIASAALNSKQADPAHQANQADPADAASQVDPADPAATAATPRIHVVAPGDCLWSIAQSYYQSANGGELADLVLDLYLANRELIGDDPNLIHPGQRLYLP